jgi:hypothetical protein
VVSITAQNISGNFTVGALTVNAPTINATGTVGSLTGLAAAHQVSDVALTSTQFFNGFSLISLPAVTLPNTNNILTSIGGQLRNLPSSSTDASGFGVEGSGFEVSISAHNVDWDDAGGDLPIKPVDYLVDLEDLFSGKRGRAADNAPQAKPDRGGPPAEARHDCVDRNSDCQPPR